ncbi:MAG TPA: hypothetical protein VE218_07945 [Acidobacteriaceae bacterium]|nr:hypothetical protein [Acidobacteriaceae bacterium]
MYPECRHVLTSGDACSSPALSTSNWCYFHSRLYQRQSQRQAARHAHRRPDGRFAALPAPSDSGLHNEAITDTIDYGPYPVGAGASASSPAVWQNASLDLPPVEDTESIQLALIDVIQALAANQIDGKRAGLLLYGLQVASANAAKLHRSLSGVRTVTYTDEGTPLAPQDYGYDVEDYEDEDEDEEESE